MTIFDPRNNPSNGSNYDTIFTRWILSPVILSVIGSENASELDEEWNNDAVKNCSQSSRFLQNSSSGMNCTSGIFYAAEFVSCIKWPLVRDEDFLFYTNNTVVYLCHNNTSCKELNYSLGYYKLSADGNIAYVCIPDKLNAYLYPIDYVCVAVPSMSLFFLVLSLFVHVWVVREIRTTDIRPMFCHQLSLTLFFLLFILINTNAFKNGGWLNDWVNIGSSYTLRAAFAWLNVISFDMWRTLHPKRILLHSQSVSSLSFFYQSLYGWGLPTLLLLLGYLLLYFPFSVVGIVSNAGPLYVNLGQLVYMTSAVTLIMLVNTFFCALVVFNLRRMRKDNLQSKLVPTVHQESYSISFKIVILSGTLWIVETAQWILTRYELSFVYWLVPESLTNAQGIWLFLIYCCNKPVLNATTQKLKTLWNDSSSQSSRIM